ALRGLARAAPPCGLPFVKIFVLVVEVVVIVLIVIFIVGLGFERRREIGHLDRRAGAIAPFLGSARMSLFFSLGSKHPVCHGDAGFKRNAADGRSTFVADDLEMVGL